MAVETTTTDAFGNTRVVKTDIYKEGDYFVVRVDQPIPSIEFWRTAQLVNFYESANFEVKFWDDDYDDDDDDDYDSVYGGDSSFEAKGMMLDCGHRSNEPVRCSICNKLLCPDCLGNHQCH
jgi:hypothetical protein